MKKSPITYFKGVNREAKRIRWPKKEQFFPSLGVVLCIMVFAAIFLFIEDSASRSIIDTLKSAFESLL
ncbi:MAG: preprotein translocase subunit SecE [Erysipelotrichaceae bacterium]|jgi:preprotein translocase SecE subunit|nr:preprotein translocase subunit SecE [Erysipelotrichaceae bacterium]